MDELNPDDNKDKELDLVGAVNTCSPAFSSSNDEKEYLLATWEKLGVGQDGLLSLNDLSKVCQAIGIEEESIQVIKQLFEGLDVDGDGRITFAEFMKIFQSANQSQVFDNSISQETFDSSNSHVTSMRSSGVFTEVGTLQSLDPDDTGFVQVSRLLGIWRDFGLQVGETFLKGLQLSHLIAEKIHLSDLSSALEEELRRQEDTKQCSFYLLLHEIRDLRTCLDMCHEERNKYKLDLQEANQRICHLAQEIDEHSSLMETASRQQISNLDRQYKEQIKELHDALKTQEELSSCKESTDIKQIENRNAILKVEENRLRQQIALQDNDIRKLISENVEVSDKLKESERQVEFMDKQVTELRFMERKIAEYEHSSPREDAYKCLLQKVDHMTSQNQILRDRNDELLSKVDSLSCRPLSHEKEDHSFEGSVIGNYLESSPQSGSLKRRSHLSGGLERDSKVMKKSSDFCEKHINIHYVDVGAYDESFDTSLPLPSDKYALRPHGCSPVSSELSPKSSHYSEFPSSPQQHSLGHDQSKCYNCDLVMEKLKQFGDIMSDMKFDENNLIVGESISKEVDLSNLEDINTNAGVNVVCMIANLQDRLELGVKSFTNLLDKYKSEKTCLDQFASRCRTMTEKIKRKRVALTRFMGEGITTIPEEDEVPSEHFEKELSLDLLQTEMALYEDKISRDRDTMEKHRAVIEERNLKMEKDIEIVKSDLASADDYWQMKIKEEQDYYEEERMLYEEKFLDLEKKIKEYEVMLKIDAVSATLTENSEESDRLSTIDEYAYWEKQYTELEEELKLVRQNNDILKKEKEHLKLSYDKERKNNANKFEDEMFPLKLELEYLRAKIRSADANSIEAKDFRETCLQKNQVDSRGVNDFSNQLVHAKKRIKRLESSLKICQKSTCEILTKNEERHQSEVEAQQTILASTQQVLTSCLAKYKDQTVKVHRTDNLVKELCLENTHLMLALQLTEERQKKAEAITRNLEMTQLYSL